mmetsp:Transcript_26809/g.50722  ORF Transcript_26809/g.50722 Transcript_26809/m.50722 type:complete len:150 (-) Transcript_26809:245-694(-)
MELTSGLSPDTSIQPTFTDVGQEVDDTHQVPSDTSGQVTVHENEFRSRQPDSFNSMGVNEVADMYDPERYDSDDKLHSTRSSSIDQDSQDVGPSADGERLEDLSREDMPDVEEPLDQSTIGQRQKGAVVYSFEDAISTKDGPQEESERA